MNFEFHPAARDELLAATTFYEDQASGLGEEFLADAERTLETLREHPSLGTLGPEGARRVPLRRFPFRIVYLVESPSLAFVLAVAHNRRRPGYWTDRR